MYGISVIGLVQAGVQVVAALSRYVSRVKEAESSRAKLLYQIRLISEAERAIESIVQESQRLGHTPELQTLIDEWVKDDGPPMKCKQELDRLAGWLDRETENSKLKNIGQKLLWPFKEDKIQAAIRVFEGYMPYFQQIVSIRTLNLVRSLVARSENAELATAKSELIKWLDGFDCTDKHESTLRQRQKTTGKWLFKEKLYINWCTGTTKFIWLHGKPGAGKSVLASAVIDDISSRLVENETLVYFYCDFRNRRCTSAREVLRSVTKQLLWNSKTDWLPSFSDLTSRKERGTGPPTDLGMLSDLLKRAAELHERPIIVVDALDECEDLSNLLDELMKLAHGRCLLFVTSQSLHSIKEAFDDMPTISLDNRFLETRDDIHLHIRVELGTRSRLRKLKQDWKDEITGILMKKADGMFRWVQCQLDRLNDCYSLGDIRVVLDGLPATLYETYGQMLRAIEKKPFGPLIARKALTWLVVALAPLRLSQLAEAISISLEKPERDPENVLMHETVILDILGSLARVDVYGTITLSHYSVKEYLTSSAVVPSTYFVDQSISSVELLTVSVFSLILFSGESKITVGHEGRSDRLYSYAKHYGFRHLVDCHPNYNALLTNHLLTFQDHVAMHLPNFNDHQWFNVVSMTSQVALYIIIRFGSLALLHHYLDFHPVQASQDDNPLVFAATVADIPHFRLLLGKGLDVNLEGPAYFDWTVRKALPLIAATRNTECHEQLVQLLLDRGCVVPRDAIHAVLLFGVEDRLKPAAGIRVLLEHGADARLLTTRSRSCMHLLLDSKNNGTRLLADDVKLEIADTLVDAGCDLMMRDDSCRSPFHLAIESNSVKWIQWFIDRGSLVPSDAILYAIRPFLCLGGREDLLSTLHLLRSRTSFAVRDSYGSNALHLVVHAALFSDIDDTFSDIVRLLVGQGCDIDCLNNAGQTPLHLAAACRSFLNVLDLFLSLGARLPIDIVNAVAMKISYANHEHPISILITLVEKYGASCRSHTPIGGDSALHCLLRGSSGSPVEEILKAVAFLVENGCDIHTPNSSGETPFDVVIRYNHLPVAQSILAQTKPRHVDHTKLYHEDAPERHDILHRLCEGMLSEFVNKVRLLQDAGYDLARESNKRDDKGFTPLCTVLRGGSRSPATISCLLDLGAKFCDVDYVDPYKLEWASKLSWYHDAIGALKRSLSRSRPAFDDIMQACHSLQVAHRNRISPTILSSILDMAEYWACVRIIRRDIQYTRAAGNEQTITLPTVPREAGCWTPRRLVFCYKGCALGPRVWTPQVWIGVYVRRTNVIFRVPISCSIEPSHYTDRFEIKFDVWDEFTPATQENGRQRLRVRELMPGETLSVEFDYYINNDYLGLEFFQVDVYYAFGPPRVAS